MQPDRQSASLDGCAHLISYHRSAPCLMVDLARYVVPTLRYGCSAREPDLDGRPYHLPDVAGHSRNRPQPWQNVMVVRGRGTRPPVCQCGATGLWDGLATASLASFRIHTSDRGHVGIEPGLQMADPVGTRERRVLASFRRSDPPQEGGHQGVVVEIEGVHVDGGGQWTVFNKGRDRLRGGLDPTGEAIGVVDQHYPKHRRMSTQRKSSRSPTTRAQPTDRSLSRQRLYYEGHRNLDPTSTTISLPLDTRTGRNRTAQTDSLAVVQRSTNLCGAGHPFTRLPTRQAHMDPLIGYKCCTNSRTLTLRFRLAV